MNYNWIPSIEVESANGTRSVALSTRHLMNRRIFITGTIDAELASNFISQLIYLEGESDEPVTVYINSPGGEVNAGLMIYDAVRNSSLEINMICTGIAASMAAVILAGGRRGRRFILKHSEVMIHEPLIANGVGGSATSIKNISESILQTRSIINGILAEHTGKDKSEVDEATSCDNYMDAEQAIEFGICDRVIETLTV